MNSLIKKLKPLALGFAYVFFGTAPVWADDTEIYFNASAQSSGVRNNLLFVIDTSGSMSSLDNDSVSRMNELKSAFKTLLTTLDNANVGLMRFSNPGGPVLYPVRNINASASSLSLTGNVTKSVQSENDDGFEFNLAHTVLLNTTELQLGQNASVSPSAGAVNVAVAVDSDDAEYRLDNNSVSLTNGDLDMSSENDTGTRQQIIGVRFANITIPVGATVTSAYMQFVESEHKSSGTMTVEIVAEKVSGGTFTSTDHPKSRYDNTTNLTSSASKVTWSSAMPGDDVTMQTPDITAMVQEVVNGSGWLTGNAMTFLFKRPAASAALGRIGFVSANSTFNRPRLIVNYTIGPAISGSVTTALRFTDVNIPRGATVTTAYLELTSGASLSDTPTRFSVSADSADNSAALSTATGDITSRVKSTAVTWDVTDPWVSGTPYESPNLTAQIQAVVNRAGWCGGNALTLLLEGNAGHRIAMAYESGSDVAPKLVVNYDKSSIPASTCQQATFSRQVSTGNDDAEQKGTATNVNSGDLDIAYDSGAQTVGIRFTNITVPQNAQIQSAYIRMRASENSSSIVNWTLKGQASNDAPGFVADNNNITDRATTSASVAWSIAAATSWVDDSYYDSPNVASIVQELVNRGGWVSGNDMAFIITGTGTNKRAVDTYNGSSGNAPTLIINYVDNTASGSSRTVRDELLEIVDSLSAGGNTPLQDTFYEAVQYFRGASVDYGKVRGGGPYAYTRVSHPDSMVSGTFRVHDPIGDAYDWSCVNSGNSACKDEYIEGSDPKYKTPIEYACQRNHIVLLTDGLPNSDHSTSKIKSTDLIGSSATCTYAGAGECVPQLARWVNTNDINTSFGGTQNVVVDTVSFYQDGAGNSFLSDTANAGGGTAKVASSASELVTALQELSSQSITTESSFVAAGAAVNAFNRMLNRDSLYFSVFKPDELPKWSGNMKKYRLAFDEGVPSIVDQNGNPAVDDATGQFKTDDAATAANETAQSYWSPSPDGPEIKIGGAGGLISNYATRRLYTDLDITKDLSDAANLVATANTSLTTAVLGNATMTAAARTTLINWIRGKDEKNEDNDAVNGSETSDTRYVFADPLHSRPVAVTYKGTDDNPDITLFVATNSGFLHAINDHDGSTSTSADGKEIFAFVPQKLLPLQKTLFDNTDGSPHPYGLDGSITSWVIDPDGDGLVLNSSGTVQANNRVILVVGMGRGGRGYYGLDVTDRSHPVVLWRIDENTPGFGDIGQTWSQPEKAIIKLSSESAKRRVVVFGGGYDANQDSAPVRQTDSMGNAVYMVDLLTGELVWSAGNGSDHDLNLSAMNYSIPAKVNGIDMSGDGLIDYFFVGDMGGQVWRFDIHNNASSAASLVTGGVIAELADATAANTRRFYNTPGMFLAKNNGTPYLGVVIGSGWRGHPVSEANVDRFYMIRQAAVFGPPSTYEKVTESQLFDATNNVIAQGSTDEQTEAKGDLEAAKGWYITLTHSGEKVLTDAVVINGEIFFSTYEPTTDATVSDPCAVQTGTNWGYRISANDARPTVDLDSDGVPELGERATAIPGAGIVGNPTLISTEDGHAMIQGTHATPVSLGKIQNIKRVYWYENRAR